MQRIGLSDDAAACRISQGSDMLSPTGWLVSKPFSRRVLARGDSPTQLGDGFGSWFLRAVSNSWSLCAILAFFVGAAGHGFAQAMTRSVNGRNVLLPLYANDASQPCALIHIEKLHRDYQTRGFYRIGLLPAVRAEDVEIEIVSPTQTRTVFSDAGSSLLGLGGSDLVELRGLRVRFRGEAEARLETRRVCIARDGAWDLLDGATLRCDGALLNLPRCRLAVGGPEAGQLLVHTGQGRAAHSLFADIKPATSPPQPAVKP